MKAILFYITSLLIVLSVCIIEVSFGYLILLSLDILFVGICRKYLTLRDIIHFTGYDIWYKYFRI